MCYIVQRDKNDSHLCPSEVEYLIKKSLWHKTPDHDRITAVKLLPCYQKMKKDTPHPNSHLQFHAEMNILPHLMEILYHHHDSCLNLLPLFSKLFEILIFERIISLIESKLPDHQFGYRNKHTTVL